MHDAGKIAPVMPKAGKITVVCAKDALILSLLFGDRAVRSIELTQVYLSVNGLRRCRITRVI